MFCLHLRFVSGIDDMFVIMQSLDNLAPHERQLNNIPQNLGQTMKHAGVAITVTSVTDIVVFAVGSSTVNTIGHFRQQSCIELFFIAAIASIEIILPLLCGWYFCGLCFPSNSICRLCRAGFKKTWSKQVKTYFYIFIQTNIIIFNFRNGFLVCYKHRNHTKTEVTGQLNLRRKIFRKIGWAINTIVGKVYNLREDRDANFFHYLHPISQLSS